MDKIAELYKNKKYEQALEAILEEEIKKPEEYDLLRYKVSVLGLLGKYADAIATADEILKIKPDNCDVLYMKGISLYHIGKYLEAEKIFNQCVALRPHFSRAVQKQISTLILLGRYKEAVELYEQGDLPTTDDSSLSNNISLSYLELGDYSKASVNLYAAKRTNPFIPQIYYNLAELYWKLKRPLKFIKHGSAFLFIMVLEKIGLTKVLIKLLIKTDNPDGVEVFFGPGRLFKSNSHIRETKSILKLLRNMQMAALCNDTWDWFAFNIPYEAAEKNGFKGDIDIMLKRPRYFGGRDAGFTYRGFEVKVTIVDISGKVRSAKRGEKKMKQIKRQLGLLKEFGCEQVFLLELFILERGYSGGTRNFLPNEVLNEINKKRIALEGTGFGYVVFIEEPSITLDDEAGGIWHPHINVLHTTNNPIGQDFKKLANKIDDFLSKAKNENADTHSRTLSHLVAYCNKCKDFTLPVSTKNVSHKCARCGAEIC